MAASFSCSLKRCLALRNSHSGLAGVLRSVFPFFLSDSSDKVDMTVCYYSSPRSPRTARSELLSALKYGNPVSTCFIIVPSLNLRSACLWYLVSVSVWYLGFEGETNLAVYTTSGFSDEHSPVISLRSSKNLEKTAYLGGTGL